MSVTEPPAAEAVLTLGRDSTELARRVGSVETFSGEHLVGDNFEVIPIPGHTPRTTAYVWDSGHERVLFSPDTIFHDREWQVALLSSSERASGVESLERIRMLEFDLLAPRIAGAGQVDWTRTNRVPTHICGPTVAITGAEAGSHELGGASARGFRPGAG